jgi:hypothetical protein
MTGHIFHPGHSELHGITVVVETRDDRTYVGRYDSEDAAGLHMLDVGIHDPSVASQLSKEEYLRKCSRFGVPNEQKHLVLPATSVVRITRLSEIPSSA